MSLYPECKTQEISQERKKELLAICEKLKDLTGGAAACDDALTQLGYIRTAMDPKIKPYFPHKGRAVGLAYTLRGCNVPGFIPGHDEVRDVVDLEYMENMEPGYFLAYGTECSSRGTIIGDVISTLAESRGVVGAVCDGSIRDLERIEPLKFLPVGATATPATGEGAVLWSEYNCIVQVGGVWIEPFDILYGDMDGVIVIPKHLAERVYELAKEICDKEDAIKADFLKYRDMKLLDIFARHKRRP